MSALRLVSQDPESRFCGRVLLIDDDAALLALMEHGFKSAGYETLTAENGRKGLQLLAAFAPDVVVTDIVMPELEGIGVILQIRRAARPPKIIAISGAGPGSRGEYLSWARHLGADEVLPKPFRTSQIVALADRLINNNSNHLTGNGS